MSLPVPELVTHTRKVQSLYKRAVRCVEAWYDRREIFRYYAVLMRERFEDNRCVDQVNGKTLLAKGEKEYFYNQHWHPRKFPESPGGVAYERVVNPPDWVVDYWHPLEKAQYPQYFACREHRKRDYIKFWDTQYGKIQKPQM